MVTSASAPGFPVSLDCLGGPTHAASCEGLPRGRPALCARITWAQDPGRGRGSLVSRLGFTVPPHPAFSSSLHRLWLNCWPRWSRQRLPSTKRRQFTTRLTFSHATIPFNIEDGHLSPLSRTGVHFWGCNSLSSVQQVMDYVSWQVCVPA